MLGEFSHASKPRPFRHDLSNISTIMKGKQASFRRMKYMNNNQKNLTGTGLEI